MTDAPPLHPKERERLRAESTLVATVQSSGEFHDDVRSAIAALEDGEGDGSPPTISFPSYDELLGTFTPRTLDLVEAVRTEEPASINEAARIVDRDVKNVHGELHRLARLGIVYFVAEGSKKRPVVWFDELRIDLPFGRGAGDAASAPT